MSDSIQAVKASLDIAGLRLTRARERGDVTANQCARLQHHIAEAYACADGFLQLAAYRSQFTEGMRVTTLGESTGTIVAIFTDGDHPSADVQLDDGDGGVFWLEDLAPVPAVPVSEEAL